MQLLLAELERSVQEVPIDKVPLLLGVLATMTAQLHTRLMQREPGAGSREPETGRYLNADEVAARFHVTKVWLYRHKRQMPHSQPSRKVLLFPERQIAHWFASRKKA